MVGTRSTAESKSMVNMTSHHPNTMSDFFNVIINGKLIFPILWQIFVVSKYMASSVQNWGFYRYSRFRPHLWDDTCQ